MRQLRLWTLTVVMTLLIWLAADQRVTKSIDIVVPFEIKPEVAHSMVVQPTKPDLQSITITLRGPNRVINKLMDSKGTVTTKIEVSDRSSGMYELNLADELRAQMDQFPEGVTIAATIPETISVEVDRYVQRRVPLVVDDGDLEFDGLPRLDPSEVTVTVPEGKFEALREDQKVIMVQAGQVFQGTPEGTPLQKEVPVPRVIGNLAVLQVEPQQVTLSATLKARTRELIIPTVPIRWIVTDNDITNRFKILLDGKEDTVTRALTVRGPTEVIRALGDDPSRHEIEGYVKINLLDAQNYEGVIWRTPRFINLPPGVEPVQDVEGVQIELIPRKLIP